MPAARPLTVWLKAPVNCTKPTWLPSGAAGLPDVKPLSDLLPGYVAIGWSGLVAPKNVPDDIVALLQRHASDALAQPSTRQRVIDMGGVVPGGTAADF